MKKMTPIVSKMEELFKVDFAAVSCVADAYRLGAVGIGVWDDGQAGP